MTRNPAFRKTCLLEKREATGQIGGKRADSVPAQGAGAFTVALPPGLTS